MTDSSKQPSPPQGQEVGLKRKLIPIGLIAIGLAGFFTLVKTKPRVTRAPLKKPETLGLLVLPLR